MPDENIRQTLETKISTLVLALAITLAAVHTSIFFFTNEPIPGESPQALAGLAAGDLSWVTAQYTSMSFTTKVILASEWLLVIIIALVSLIRGRMRLNKELKSVNTQSRATLHKEKPETDIDVLYEMLQKDKILRINAIGKIFGVDTKTALEWCRILESCNLAEIRYPTVGDPKIILSDEKSEDENE